MRLHLFLEKKEFAIEMNEDLLLARVLIGGNRHFTRLALPGLQSRHLLQDRVFLPAHFWWVNSPSSSFSLTIVRVKGSSIKLASDMALPTQILCLFAKVTMSLF